MYNALQNMLFVKTFNFKCFFSTFVFLISVRVSVVKAIEIGKSPIPRQVCRSFLGTVVSLEQFNQKVPELDTFLSQMTNQDPQYLDEVKKTYLKITKRILGSDKNYYFHLLMQPNGPNLVELEIWSLVDRANQDQNFPQALNRVGLYKRFLQFIQDPQRKSDKVTVVFFDLSFFKIINELLGQDEADSILNFFIGELTRLKRATDFVGRWGGDEIILVLDANVENTELKVLARLQEIRFHLIDKYKQKILDRINSSEVLSKMVENAIKDSEVSPQQLASIGVMSELKERSFLTFKEKIEKGVVVMGAARSGFSEIDLSNAIYSEQNLSIENWLDLFDVARNKAEDMAVGKKELEKKALGTNSRPESLR
jgi:diguanylate cyclase (GGDEF)-like protein